MTSAQRKQYEQIKQIVQKMVPDVEETKSYGIIALKHKGKYVIYVGAFKNHMSVFPPTFRFTDDDPVPEAKIKEIVSGRLKVINKS